MSNMPTDPTMVSYERLIRAAEQMEALAAVLRARVGSARYELVNVAGRFPEVDPVDLETPDDVRVDVINALTP